MRKDGGDHTTARPATADPFSIRPPPLPGIFGVPGSGSLIARKPREVIRQAHADQSAGDFGESEAEMMGEILEEDEGWLDLPDDPSDMRPDLARLVGTPLFFVSFSGSDLNPVWI